jgi:hypothetical protein
MCDEWKGHPEVFIKWALENGYKEGLIIDRENNDAGYSPANCRFVTPLESARNKRSNIMLTYNGDTHCISEWSEKIGVRYERLRSLVKKVGPDAAIKEIIQNITNDA